MDKLDLILQKIENVDSRLGKIDDRLDGIDGRLDGIDGRLDGLEKRMDRLESRMDGLESRMDGLESRMDGLESRTENLETGLANAKEELGKKIAGVELNLENQVCPSVRIIAENHLELYKNLKSIIEFKPSHDLLEIRVSSLEISMKRIKEVLENLKSA